MEKTRRSLRKKIATKKKQDFIGREKQLAIFRANFNENAADDESYNIFNIHGQGGVGKTTLSRQYERIAKENKALVAFIDLESDIKNIPALMAEIVKQLKTQNADFSEFDKKYKTFRQEKEQLEKDPDAPKGFSNMIGSTLTKIMIAKTEKFIGAELSEVLPKEAMASFGGDAASFIRQKITNKDEIQLLLEPIEVLTPIFIEEIDKNSDKYDICIIFDTYETAFPKLDDWLRSIYGFEHGEGIDRLLTVISGRDELSEKWNEFTPITHKILLEQFTHEEAVAFLKSKNIINETIINTLIEVSDRFPILLVLLSDNPPTSIEEINDVSGNAIERFLKWIKNPEEREVLLAAALPRAINQDMVGELLDVLGIDKAKCQTYYDLLNNQPFVQQRGDIKTYHPVIKAQMLKYRFNSSPKTWREQHYILAKYFDAEAALLGFETLENQYINYKWLKFTIEATYHKLCANFEKELPSAVESMAIHLDRTRNEESTINWSQIIAEAGKLVNEEKWSLFIQKGLSGFIADDEVIALEFFEQINEQDWIKEPLAKSLFYGLIGSAYYDKNEIGKAIENYEKAIELNPNLEQAYNNLGTAYKAKKELGKAIENYEKAIELNPENQDWLMGLAATYFFNNNLLKSLTTFQKVVELNEKNILAHTNIGFIYIQQEDYEEANKYIQKAWELSDFKNDFTAKNIAHLSLLQEDKAIAIEKYKAAIPLWESLEEYLGELESDYEHLKMEEKGISKVEYAEILEVLKD